MLLWTEKSMIPPFCCFTHIFTKLFMETLALFLKKKPESTFLLFVLFFFSLLSHGLIFCQVAMMAEQTSLLSAALHEDAWLALGWAPSYQLLSRVKGLSFWYPAAERQAHASSSPPRADDKGSAQWQESGQLKKSVQNLERP